MLRAQNKTETTPYGYLMQTKTEKKVAAEYPRKSSREYGIKSLPANLKCRQTMDVETRLDLEKKHEMLQKFTYLQEKPIQ